MTTEIVLEAPKATAQATAIMTEGSYCSANWASLFRATGGSGRRSIPGYLGFSSRQVLPGGLSPSDPLDDQSAR